MRKEFLLRSFLASILFLFTLFRAVPVSGADKTTEKEKPPLFNWDLLWTGSWNNSLLYQDDELSPPGELNLFSGGTMYNRGNLTLGMPRQGLAFRFLATDKRDLPPAEDDGRAGFNPAFGVYHHGSGSRLLYGVQSEYGLPARLHNVWVRAIPFMESRALSSRDLKAEPSARDGNETYLYLALPRKFLPAFDAFASAVLDEELNPAFGGGIGWHGSSAEIRLEGFYTRKTLAPRLSGGWFSEAPPLPERDFSIYALGLVFYSPWVSFATDWALSEAFAWGEGVYANFALTLGQRPWRFSLAGDGAGDRFSDRGGSTAGAGFRLAAKGERFWPRSGLLRFQGSARSAGLDEDFSRFSFSAYFRPPAPGAAERRNPLPFRFSRASLGLSRDARRPEKTSDSLDLLAGFNIGPLNAAFSCALHHLSRLDGGNENFFRYPVFESFDSAKFSGELGWKPPGFRFGSFDLRARLGYTLRAEKDPLWEFAMNSSFRPGKWGRLGLKIASADFPEKWSYTLSWRFEKEFP